MSWAECYSLVIVPLVVSGPLSICVFSPCCSSRQVNVGTRVLQPVSSEVLFGVSSSTDKQITLHPVDSEVL